MKEACEERTQTLLFNRCGNKPSRLYAYDVAGVYILVRIACIVNVIFVLPGKTPIVRGYIRTRKAPPSRA